jgi:hypothetical protein
MGKRYVRILEYLEYNHSIEDIHGDSYPLGFGELHPTHYIIATPTESHINILEQTCGRREFLHLEPAKILVEKPIFTTDDSMKAMISLRHLEAKGHKIYMVNNYAYYPFKPVKGKTTYDFYNSGGDDRAWDCIQLIHLAEDGVDISGLSPLWECIVNGTRLNRERLDYCYVEMIEDFLSDNKRHGKLWGYEDIYKAHEEVIVYERSFNRNTSPVNVNAAREKGLSSHWREEHTQQDSVSSDEGVGLV